MVIGYAVFFWAHDSCPTLWMHSVQFSSVQFSVSVMSNSLWPHESQHASPPCPSPTPGVYPNSCPLSRWGHPAISSSVIPFSSCPQPLSSVRVFSNDQLFTWGGQSIGVLASASVLPMNIQDWSPLEWTGWISLQSKEFSRVVRIQDINISFNERGEWKTWLKTQHSKN